MQLYNTLSQKIEQVHGGPQKRVNLFVCGPTVYDFSHIGHARTYLFYDALVKFFRSQLGWDVFYLQNITNIDDKIIQRAAELGEDPLELAQMFEEEYYKDMNDMGIDAVNTYARATDHISEIISQVEGLLKSKHAYIIEGDGVYFDVTTFKDYGRLARRTVEQAEDAVTRIDESITKRNRADFALWKFSKPNEPNWDAPFGAGRPGWHIEDTAISHKHFGYSYDMHGGAIDLIFPHHEAEIAQMESLSGVSPMARMWVHTGFLTLNGEKMSKSVGNFITIRAFLAENSPQIFRMFVFSSLYRSPVDFTVAAVEEAKGKIDRISELASRLSEVTTQGVSPFPIDDFQDAFWGALKSDFNTPKAFAELFQLTTETNKLIDAHTLSAQDAQKLLAFLAEVNAIFNLLPNIETNVPAHIASLIAKREEAREEGRYEDADKIRQQILGDGFDLKDTESGPRISRK